MRSDKVTLEDVVETAFLTRIGDTVTDLGDKISFAVNDGSHTLPYAVEVDSVEGYGWCFVCGRTVLVHSMKIGAERHSLGEICNQCLDIIPKRKTTDA
jgi:hypothetical protein